ncbi:MAG TPA: hypothetical protein VFI23_03725 [Rhizomicrobium sp.]|nr:hypothetical protein [Rhizomicrobium sp.]
MRNLIAAALSASLMTASAFGADNGALAPGKPAGVHQAQDMNMGTNALIIITGIVVAGVAIGLSTSSDGNPGGPVALTTVPTTTAG